VRARLCLALPAIFANLALRYAPSSTVHPPCSVTLEDCVTCGRPKALLLRYKEVAAPSKTAASPCLTSCTTLLYAVETTITHLEPLNYRAAITLHHLPDEASRRSVSSARSRTYTRLPLPLPLRATRSRTSASAASAHNTRRRRFCGSAHCISVATCSI
jgi:hypothetical protein